MFKDNDEIQEVQFTDGSKATIKKIKGTQTEFEILESDSLSHPVGTSINTMTNDIIKR